MSATKSLKTSKNIEVNEIPESQDNFKFQDDKTQELARSLKSFSKAYESIQTKTEDQFFKPIVDHRDAINQKILQTEENLKSLKEQASICESEIYNFLDQSEMKEYRYAGKKYKIETVDVLAIQKGHEKDAIDWAKTFDYKVLNRLPISRYAVKKLIDSGAELPEFVTYSTYEKLKIS